jgi:hypothetical protein
MAHELIEEYNILRSGEISAVQTLDRAMERVQTEGRQVSGPCLR